ncbi:MAG: hypothetical protein WBM17_05060 [Anaerolineales bacterium]
MGTASQAAEAQAVGRNSLWDHCFQKVIIGDKELKYYRRYFISQGIRSMYDTYFGIMNTILLSRGGEPTMTPLRSYENIPPSINEYYRVAM